MSSGVEKGREKEQGIEGGVHHLAADSLGRTGSRRGMENMRMWGGAFLFWGCRKLFTVYAADITCSCFMILCFKPSVQYIHQMPSLYYLDL